MAVATEVQTLEVCEIFTSIQGEGTRIGVPSTFVRMLRCNLHCAWCLDEDSMVLMGDYSEKRLGDLEVGDVVLAADRDSGNLHWARARVERVEKAVKPCVELQADGASVVLTPDHQLWKVKRSKWAEAQELVGHQVRYLGRPTEQDAEYLRGYLTGSADGDGTFWSLKKGAHSYRRFRIATRDVEILERTAEALEVMGIDFYWGRHARTGFSGQYETMDALYVTRGQQAEALESLVAADVLSSESWRKGYMAGLFDTDGTTSGGGSLRWTQQKPRVRNRLKAVLENHGLSYSEESEAIRVTGVAPLTAFVLGLAPASMRKVDELVLREAKGSATVQTITPVGDRTIVTLTTSMGSYIANGFLVKNCDTTYSWKDGERVEGVRMTPAQILAEVHAPDVVLTGGEPMLQDLAPLLGELGDRHVTIETNATIFKPYDRVNLWSLSPKLGSSGHKPNKRVISEFLAHYPHKLQLKFVVGGPEDLEAVKALLSELPAVAERQVPVILQPVGRPEVDAVGYLENMRRLVEEQILPDAFWQQYQLRFLPQFHRLLWGDKRGI